MWILVVVLAVVLVISVLGYRQVLATTQVDAQLRLEPWSANTPRSRALERAVSALQDLGYTLINELASKNAGTATNQKSIARLAVLMDPAATTWAIAYELSNLLPGADGVPDIGAQVTTIDLVSLLESGRGVTTSNAKLGFFDKNPKNSEHKVPLAGSVPMLVELHRAHLTEQVQTSPAKDLRKLDFAQHFIGAWLETFEFQTTRGLFLRDGAVFKAKPKLAIRGVLNYWMPLRDPQGWRWLLHLGWTGLIVSGLGALLRGSEVPELLGAAGLGAVAGALGAAVFHPTSVFFTLALGILGSQASGFEGFVYPVALIFVYISVDRWRGQRIAAIAKQTIEASS